MIKQRVYDIDGLQALSRLLWKNMYLLCDKYSILNA